MEWEGVLARWRRIDGPDTKGEAKGGLLGSVSCSTAIDKIVTNGVP